MQSLISKINKLGLKIGRSRNRDVGGGMNKMFLVPHEDIPNVKKEMEKKGIKIIYELPGEDGKLYLYIYASPYNKIVSMMNAFMLEEVPLPTLGLD